MAMRAMRVLAPAAVVLLAACGGGGNGEDQDGGAATRAGDASADTAALPPGTVDTAGMGVNPPTAGGQIVDTAAFPGPIDTAVGTSTAP